jgi:hypothetical protein
MLEPDEWSGRMRWLAVAVINSMMGGTRRRRTGTPFKSPATAAQGRETAPRGGRSGS